MTAQTSEDRLVAAREARDRHDWLQSYRLLTELDHESRLDGAGLELLGEIAWWAMEPDVSLTARERAFAAYMAEGDRIRAAYMALMASHDHRDQQHEAVAGGWFARAARILADEPESFAHGYLRFFESMALASEAQFDAAAEKAAQAVGIGARAGDKDVQAYGLVAQGMALVRRGDIEQGLSLLDEATAAAVAGELTPFTTGLIYCMTISTCRDLADYRRAGQWTEVAERWCERQSINGFPGVCRVHRAEILALRGEWANAEDEARRASAELLSFKALEQAAEAYYTLGEIRMRIGDLVGAEEAFRESDSLGHDPQPGRSLLYLAQDRVDAARASIERAFMVPDGERLTRARLLPAHVEIALAGGDVAAARKSAEELSQIAQAFRSPALHAAAHCALGAVYVAEGEAEAALQELGRARAHWQSVDAPYELARTRSVIASALRLRGDTEAAALELEAARAAFTRLGASPDALRCQRMLDELRGRAEQGERQRRTFVFTDIVGSTELIAVIGDDAWGDIVRWHNQTLRTLATRHGGEEVNEAGDGFFFAFTDVRSAVDAAVAIQRALAEHRRTAGFAPRVRIGLHATEATKTGDTYLGQGVHQAARIGALAGAGEIVASAETLEGLAVDRAGTPRAVELKGIPGTVDVRTIDWTPAA